MKQNLIIILFFISLNTYAGVNKWVDADGNVHYSDTPPENIKTTKIKSAAPPDTLLPESNLAAPKTLAEREAEWKKSQKAKEESALKASQEQAAAAIKQKNCEGARGNLAALEHGTALVTYNEKGERSFLDDAGRKQRIDEAQQAISSYCN